MAITEMLLWWYASGWNVFLKKLRNWLASIADFFSMGSLIRTLFKPYRQISADTANRSASLDIKFHMFLDRLVSRLIGFISRLVILIIGSCLILLGSLFSFLLLLLWPFIPLFPIIGIILSIIGFIL